MGMSTPASILRRSRWLILGMRTLLVQGCGRSVFVSGMEMTIVGAVEAAITYSLGLLFHASGA